MIKEQKSINLDAAMPHALLGANLAAHWKWSFRVNRSSSYLQQNIDQWYALDPNQLGSSEIEDLNFNWLFWKMRRDYEILWLTDPFWHALRRWTLCFLRSIMLNFVSSKYLNKILLNSKEKNTFLYSSIIWESWVHCKTISLEFHKADKVEYLTKSSFSDWFFQ